MTRKAYNESVPYNKLNYLQKINKLAIAFTYYSPYTLLDAVLPLSEVLKFRLSRSVGKNMKYHLKI